MQRAINHINFCIVFVYTDCITDACVAVWYFPVSIEVCGHTVISKVFPYLQETAVVKNPKVYNIKEKGVIFHPVGTYFYSFCMCKWLSFIFSGHFHLHSILSGAK